MKNNIVIVGGGAGGLELATNLGKKLGRKQKANVILVDKNPTHLWKPLLHEIAAGVLDDSLNNVNYLAQGKRNGFQFKQGALLNIDRENKYILLDETKNANNEIIFPKSHLPYDILVIAIGSLCNDFGIPGVKEHCVFLEDVLSAKQFHRTMLTHLFRLSSGLKPENQTQLQVAIVGAGATGVELSSELFTMIQQLRSYGFNHMTSGNLKVTLIEAADHVLPALPEKLAQSIHHRLEQLGVNILTRTCITEATKTAFHTKDNEILEAQILVWVAGVKAPDFLKNIGGLESTPGNQLLVKPGLQTTLDDTIFAIGDCASHRDDNGKITPPTAQAAHQMATLTATNILALLRNKPLKPFHYKDRGTIISLSQTAEGVITVPGKGKKQIIIKGNLAYFIYHLLYHMHQAALYGIIRTGRLILAGRVFRSIRTSLKLN